MPTPDTRTIVHEMLAAVASVNCNAEADDHTTACDKMTEILLAKWEECERLRAENAALRTRSREIAEASDRRNAELQSRVAKYEQANERAKKDVEHLCADWAVEPYKSTPGTFWSMTSEHNRNVLTVIAGRVIGLQSRLAAAEAVVSAARIVNKSHDHSTACLSAWVRGVDGCKCGLRELASALSTYDGKSE